MKKNIIIIIISVMLLFSCSSNENKSFCKIYKNGRFIYLMEKSLDTILIERNDTVQIETNLTTKNKIVEKIKWISDCEYEVSYLEQTKPTSDTIVASLQNQKITTTILKANKNYCVYKAEVKGYGISIVDTLIVF